jgi:hypothetical protein
MGVYQFENRYSAPSREQRDRYMRGDYEEHTFGPDRQILLVVYDEAVYIKDDIEDVRILFTGEKDKEKAYQEVQRLVEYYRQKEEQENPFRPGTDC